MSRWYHRPGHPRANHNNMVAEEDLGDYRVELATNAPISVGRFYEEVGPATDGTPLNSKTKHREYMKRHGVTVSSDYSPSYWEKAETDRAKRLSGDYDHKERRESVARAWYEHVEKRKG